MFGIWGRVGGGGGGLHPKPEADNPKPWTQGP